MVSLVKLPSTTTVFSAYTSVIASVMFIRAIGYEARSILEQFIPEQVQRKIISFLESFYGNPSHQLTLIINENIGFVTNEMYEASEIYLRTKINSPSLQRLAVRKHPRENLTVLVDKDQDIVESYQGVKITWKLICTETNSGPNGQKEDKYFELSFNKQHKELVLESYLPYILKRSKAISEENRVLKLYSLGFYDGEGNVWGSINLEHPATFDTLAMDTNLKNEILEDLDRFVKRKEFYRRVGKPWKRGYLLYGPPGTGKSSLVAAMANYLNFHIYDMELASLYNNSELRRLLVATANRSILVIEDIDCSVQLHDRTTSEESNNEHDGVTLSGVLNFIDGLWSSCGDERIIVFTTNHKDKLDPALLRPGRMDMHICMSYCTPCGFRLLASNYLQLQSHPLFEEIEFLLRDVNATPAEVAEVLLKTEDVKTCLGGLIEFLQNKKTTCDQFDEEGARNEDVKSDS